MNKYRGSTKSAVRIAMEYAGLEISELRCAEISAQDTLSVIHIDTDFMRYEFYVDVENKEILGFNSEPVAYQIPGPIIAAA